MSNKCVFIDRDDTIAKNVPYCDSPDKFNLYPGVPQQIKKLKDAGFLVIMITNQSGINRGYFTVETLNAIHEKMNKEIEAAGGCIDAIYYCPHRPDEKCKCRKPNAQLGKLAVSEYDIDISRSYMVGDSDMDEGFAKNLGCQFCKVGEGTDFNSCVDFILSH